MTRSITVKEIYLGGTEINMMVYDPKDQYGHRNHKIDYAFIRDHINSFKFARRVKITENRHIKEVDFRVISIISNHLLNLGYKLIQSKRDDTILRFEK